MSQEYIEAATVAHKKLSDAANHALNCELLLNTIDLPDGAADKLTAGLDSQKLQSGRTHLHLRKLAGQVLSSIRSAQTAMREAAKAETPGDDVLVLGENEATEATKKRPRKG